MTSERKDGQRVETPEVRSSEALPAPAQRASEARVADAVGVVRRIRALVDHSSMLATKERFVAELMGILDSTDVGAIGEEPRVNEASPPWLPDLLTALGWSGGTVHQAIAEVGRLRKLVTGAGLR